VSGGALVPGREAVARRVVCRRRGDEGPLRGVPWCALLDQSPSIKPSSPLSVQKSVQALGIMDGCLRTKVGKLPIEMLK